MSSDQLASIAGIVLSLLFSYFPGLSDKYNGLDPVGKRIVMAGLLLVVAVAAFALSCGSIVDISVTCDKAGALGLVSAFIAALIANQATYLLTPRPLAKS